MHQHQFRITGPKDVVDKLLKQLQQDSLGHQFDLSGPFEDPCRVNQPEAIDLVLSYVIGVAGNATYGWLRDWLKSHASSEVSVRDLPPPSKTENKREVAPDSEVDRPDQ